MATVHKGRQSLNRKAGKNFVLSALSGGAFLYCVFMMLGGFFAGFSPLFYLLPLVCLWAAAVYWKRYRRLHFGAAGERMLLKELKRLPAPYHVFTNYVMRFGGGFDEADFIVVGESGVFVIEAKHHAGVITGRAGEEKWRQEKLKAKGRTQVRQMKNPLKQTKRHLKNVVKILKKRRFDADVRAILVFTNPNVRLRIEAEGVLVLRGGGQIRDFILDYPPEKKLDKGEIRALVQQLRDTSGA